MTIILSRKFEGLPDTLLIQTGQDQQVIDTLRQARPDAQGTDMDAVV
jgi:hypothetical protein